MSYTDITDSIKYQHHFTRCTIVDLIMTIAIFLGNELQNID